METTCHQCQKDFPRQNRIWFDYKGKEIHLCSDTCHDKWKEAHPVVVEKDRYSRMPNMGCGRLAY